MEQGSGVRSTEQKMLKSSLDTEQGVLAVSGLRDSVTRRQGGRAKGAVVKRMALRPLPSERTVFLAPLPSCWAFTPCWNFFPKGSCAPGLADMPREVRRSHRKVPGGTAWLGSGLTAYGLGY